MRLVLLATLLAACTFVYVEGDGNRFNDTGGDVSSRLNRPQSPASGPAINPQPHAR